MKTFGKLMMLLVAFLSAWALLFFLLNEAFAYSGEDLSKDCENNIEYCKGFILGVDMGTTHQHLAEWRKVLLQTGEAYVGVAPICYKTGVHDLQLVEVVLKYLKSNQEKLHYSAGQLVRVGLMKNFPCTTFRPLHP